MISIKRLTCITEVYAFFNLGEYHHALQDIEDCRESSAEYPDYRYIGMVYETSREFKKAINIYSNVIKNQPKNYIAYFLRGKFFTNQSNPYLDLNKGISDLIMAISLEPSEPEIYLLLGLTYMDKQDIESAILIFKKAIRKFSIADCDEIYYELGKVFSLIGEQDKSLNCFQLLIEYMPNDPHYNQEIGKLFLKMKDLENAKKHLKRAIKYNSNNCTSYSYLAEALIENHEYKEAINVYSKIMETCPHCETAWVHSTLMIFAADLSLNDEISALEAIENALQTFPQSEQLHSFILGCKNMLFRLKLEVIKNINNPFFQAVAKIRTTIEKIDLFQILLKSLGIFGVR